MLFGILRVNGRAIDPNMRAKDLEREATDLCNQVDQVLGELNEQRKQVQLDIERASRKLKNSKY